MNQRTTYPYLTLINELCTSQKRLFSLTEAKKCAHENKIAIPNVQAALTTLRKCGLIHSLRRGTYIIDDLFSGTQPVHEFELAAGLVKPSTISHFSAFQYHEFTDQLPQIIFATTPSGITVPRKKDGELFVYNGIRYCYIQTKPDHYFGIDHYPVGQLTIPITNRERTLLDGLAKPKYCGGIQEVLAAYEKNEFCITKIIDYAQHLDVSVVKRLGWVLEELGIEQKKTNLLATIPFKGFAKLDPSGPNRGPYSKRWHIRENL